MKALTVLSDRQIKNRLLRWYNLADQKQFDAGCAWYNEAKDFCNTLGEEYSMSPYKIAAVVSALSPQNKWEQNLKDTETVLKAFSEGLKPEDIKVCTFHKNKQKAFDILTGNENGQIIGNKTHAFAMNVGLNSPDHVTIDRWHIRACIEIPGLKPKTEKSLALTNNEYRRLERLTVETTKKINELHNLCLTSYQVQAIVWLTIKENRG